TTGAIVHARNLIILATRANGQPKCESSARERMQRSSFFREVRGVAQRANRNHRDEAHSRGDGGGSGEREEANVASVGGAVEHAQTGEWTGLGAASPFEE